MTLHVPLFKGFKVFALSFILYLVDFADNHYNAANLIHLLYLNYK